jgi:hypothetical protein
MATVKAHYEQVLSKVYSWMCGGLEINIEKNSAFFREHMIRPRHSARAVDLGAGCGFQSIPLAQAGFSVTAIDSDERLLAELKEHANGLQVTIVQDDLMRCSQYIETPVELVVCMTDTLLHLPSKESVCALFKTVSTLLEPEGIFVITFRDLSSELSELDRFIPVKSDADTIFTCFLEYEEETVKVHDLVYTRNNAGWDLHKSFYRKLRLSQTWVETQLKKAGFSRIDSTITHGCLTIIASH